MKTMEVYLNEEVLVFKKLRVKVIDVLFFLGITLLAILARIVLFEFSSRDYEVFLSSWVNRLAQAGGLKGIGLSLGDYTPPYIYILSILTNLPMNSLFSIKIVSCLFDFACAFLFLKMTYQYSKKTSTALAFYTVFLFAPTIILNSAFWAQCDIIFTFFLILCIYYFTKEKPFMATMFFGVAFCFKLQAVFLAPLLILLWLKGKMKLQHFLIIPAVYLVSILPAWIAGRPLMELLTIYQVQAGQYSGLSLNAPNLYTWISNDYAALFSKCGIFISVAVVGLVLYICFTRKFKIDTRMIVLFSLFFTLLIPFVLPHMHERYFYTADVIALLYVLYMPKRFYIAVGVWICSLLSYCPYLFRITPINLQIVAIFMLVILLIVSVDLISQMRKNAILEN